MTSSTCTIGKTVYQGNGNRLNPFGTASTLERLLSNRDPWRGDPTEGPTL
jgi:hypothetical protein